MTFWWGRKCLPASPTEEKSSHLENNCLLWLVPQYILMHDVKVCFMYLIKSSRTCDLGLWVREQVTKDANGHAAVNPDQTLDQYETGKIQTKKKGAIFSQCFNYLSETKKCAQQPFSFLINWELGQKKERGVSAELKTCTRKQFGVVGGRFTSCHLLSIQCSASCPTCSVAEKAALANYLIDTKWHFCELIFTTT